MPAARGGQGGRGMSTDGIRTFLMISEWRDLRRAAGRRAGSARLVGAGVGAILFLLLLLAGTLLFEEASISNGGGMMLLSCLCGGAMAGILGSRPKKKRKR